jgi:hypothetical protein
MFQSTYAPHTTIIFGQLALKNARSNQLQLNTFSGQDAVQAIFPDEEQILEEWQLLSLFCRFRTRLAENVPTRDTESSSMSAWLREWSVCGHMGYHTRREPSNGNNEELC